MKRIGFEMDSRGKVIEYLPSSRQLKSRCNKRVMFFELFNAYFEDIVHFNHAEYYKKGDIFETFEAKIDSMLPKRVPYRAQPSKRFEFDMIGTKVIHSYLANEKIPLLGSAKLGVAKLIQLLFSQKSASLIFDLDDAFIHLVHKRMQKVNPKGNVTLDSDAIMVDYPTSDYSTTKVIPLYEYINRDNIKNELSVQNYMDEIIEELNHGKARSIYLVYPKHNDFDKHITIDLQNRTHLNQDEYRIKLIPYSFSFCTKASHSKGCSIKK
jgi:hypothetical protein